MAGLAGVGTTVFIAAFVMQTLQGPPAPKSNLSAAASPIPNQPQGVPSSANPTGSPTPGENPLVGLPADIIDPATQCSPYKPPYAWPMPGLIQALSCHAPGLPHGEIYAFQLKNSASFQLSWDNFNRWWHFDLAQAGRSCPPAGGHRQGARGFTSSDFPPRPGQVLECQGISARSGGGGSAPAYAWALPSEDTFFVAQGADGSSFTALDSWWTSNVTRAPVSPQTPTS
jgi:hypothetical protein